jgi:hypothetical protein
MNPREATVTTTDATARVAGLAVRRARLLAPSLLLLTGP